MSKQTRLPEKFKHPTDSRPLYQIKKVGKLIKVDKKSFNTPSEAYDYVERELNGNAWWEPNTFTKADGTMLEDNGANIFEDDWMSDKGRLLFNSHPDRELEYITMIWDQWLKTYKQYKKNPKGFYESYNFLNNHPMFWTLEGKPESQLFWETENGLGKPGLWHTVFYAQDNSSKKQRQTKAYKKANKKNGRLLVHLLEHGPAFSEKRIVNDVEVEIPNRILSRDIYLDTKAFTYEEAIIKLAAKVMSRYKKDGEQRKTAVKQEKKDWAKAVAKYEKKQAQKVAKNPEA